MTQTYTIHIESDTNSVNIPTVHLPYEALPTETTNFSFFSSSPPTNRDSPPSYADVGPPPNYEDVVKDSKIQRFKVSIS
jgi:hypothetical protein